MVLVKILKRKDGSSIVAAIAVGFLLINAVQAPTYELSSKLVHLGSSNSPVQMGPGWRDIYVQPLVALVIGLIVLEVLAWIYILLEPMLEKALANMPKLTK